MQATEKTISAKKTATIKRNTDKIMKFEKFLRTYSIQIWALFLVLFLFKVCETRGENGGARVGVNITKDGLIKGLADDQEMFKAVPSDLTKSTEDDQENSEEEDNEDFVLVDLSEFVAQIKGGLKSAKKIAQKYNLKLVKRVNLF